MLCLSRVWASDCHLSFPKPILFCPCSSRNVTILTVRRLEFVLQRCLGSRRLGSLLHGWNANQGSHSNALQKTGWEGWWIKIGSPASQKHGFASQSWQYFQRGTQRIARGRQWLIGALWMSLKSWPFPESMRSRSAGRDETPSWKGLRSQPGSLKHRATRPNNEWSKLKVEKKSA